MQEGSQPCELVAHSKVKGRLVVPVGFVCAQNLLDSAVDLLPVGRTGPTGLDAGENTTDNNNNNKRH